MALPFNLHWDAPGAGTFEIRMHTGTILSLTILPENQDDLTGSIHFLRWYGLKIGGGSHNLWRGEFNDASSGLVQLSFTIVSINATVQVYTPIGNARVSPNQTQTFTWRRTPQGFAELEVAEGEYKPEEGA